MGTGARAKKMCDIDAVRRGNVLRRGSRMRAISMAAALVVALVTAAGVSAASAQAPSLPITLPGLPSFPNPLDKRAHSVSAFGVRRTRR